VLYLLLSLVETPLPARSITEGLFKLAEVQQCA
jgi:hypothetical protein